MDTIWFYVLVGLVLTVFWVIQFAQLMVLSDSDFPGKYDKILWVVAFTTTWVLAAFAFLWWRRMMIDVRALERESQKAEKS